MAQGAAFSAPVITEFLASNETGLRDEDGDASDWIEIHNPGATPLSLADHYLSDDATNLRKWRLPDVSLAPGAYRVIFASGKDRRDPATQLHTSFSLSDDGEYLALTAPDGVTVLSAFAPAFPPQFEDDSFGRDSSGTLTYFPAPTPGAANGPGTPAGPALEPVQKDPPQPVTGPLTIEARVRPLNDPVDSVTLHFRHMMTPETSLEMRDDGAAPDRVAGDGIWTATIPATAFSPGRMTRWRFVATDTRGIETRVPAFRDPLDSHQYFGTVAHDEGVQTLLPVLHWFISNPGGAGTERGSRGALYYDGEFYDNVLFTLHGQSSSGFPKKSYNIDFNRTQRFRWSEAAPRVADIDLLTNWADKSKVRHVLAYEIMRQSGVAAHFAFTVRVQQNGSFFSTADVVEDADEIYLERAGLNPDGALYKVYSNQLNRDIGNTGNSGVEKKNRKSENNNDLQELINGLDRNGTALRNYLFDHIDIPACVNMLAANSVIRNIDMHSKNWYIYRDTGRTDEWAILPWDLDLSHGRVWNQQNTYFDNALYTDGFVVNSTSVRLVAHLFANPDTRAMLMRRIRTLSDRFLQAPETPLEDRYYERRLDELSALIDPPSIVPSDARRDFEKWGSWLQRGSTVSYTNTNPAVETMAEAIARFRNEYLPGRRQHIYGRQIVGRGGEIPLPQDASGASTNYTPLLLAGATAKVLVPTSGGLGSTWRGNPAAEPFDTSGWITGRTGVGYERGSGYESLIRTDVENAMRNNTTVYIRLEFNLADPNDIEGLELRMKFDDGFAAYLNGTLLASVNAPSTLQWNSAATVSQEANPAAFRSYDVSQQKGALRAGRNVLAIHGLNDTTSSSDLIFVPELHATQVAAPTSGQPVISFGEIEPSPASGNQDEEYIQLLNPHPIAVDISDWRLAGAVRHTFPGGTVLPPSGSLYVSPNAAAFRSRSASPTGGEGHFVQGGYQGHLSSRGERITLLDASGAPNNTATYEAEPSDLQRYLAISELMYAPAGNSLAEFIELLNISSSVTLDLSQVRFTEGVDFDFTGQAITSLPPGARVLVVRDLAAFTAVYGTNLPVAGAFADDTALNNGGETLKLEDAQNGTILEFTYDDGLPWPVNARNGYSLVLITPESSPNPALPENWRASSRLGGSPGKPEDSGFSGDPMADGDGNGERDLIDYVLGNAPGVPPVPVRVSAGANSTGSSLIQLSYPVSLTAENASVAAYVSTDLVTWQDGAPHLELVSSEPLAPGRALLTWTVKPPLRDEPRVFLRLRAVAD